MIIAILKMIWISDAPENVCGRSKKEAGYEIRPLFLKLVLSPVIKLRLLVRLSNSLAEACYVRTVNVSPLDLPPRE